MSQPARSRWVDRTGAVQALVLAVVLGALGWVRHRNHWSGAFDLGIFDQAVWQLSRGETFVSLVNRNIFADHFSPVLLAFVPLYWLAATPLWLIAGQALALGTTVLPLRVLARDLRAPLWTATLLVAASAPLLAAAMFDFHPGTLAVPWVAVLMLAARRDDLGWALVAAVVVELCRADLGSVILGVAIVAGPRTRWPLALVGAVGAGVGASIPALFGGTSGWDLHYGHLGSSPVQALLHPWDVAGALLSAGSLRPLLTWILAAGCLVLLRPRWLLAVVVAGLPVLLSSWGATDLPWYHYGAPVAPIAIAGTLSAIGGRGWGDGLARYRPAVLGASVVVALAIASPLSARAPDQFQLWTALRPSPGRSEAAAAVSRILRDDDVVSADNQLVPHLAHREGIFMFPLPFAPAEGFLQGGADPELVDQQARLVDVVVAPAGTTIDGYDVVGRVEGFVILRRSL